MGGKDCGIGERGCETQSLVREDIESACLLFPISPYPKSSLFGHTSDPNYVLALTQAIYGFVPQAWCLMIPGVNFEFGESLSPVAKQGVETALQKIDELIQTIRKKLCMKLK
ncbi:hypothetical protein [Scytonema sp. UIC 10036]|uniref:hypothetical protein n=1 Tax=Scytonema sp. UIC 10036 TaxID=2304196 RepID=UPI001FAA2229|nr:hypothetical protein [Scytonema sp. UIC 10036]